jgi:uncharacterized membrane protein YbhN (UPF0104 family)
MSERLRRWWKVLKVVLAVAVVLGIGWHLFRILHTEELNQGDERTPAQVLWDAICQAAPWPLFLSSVCYVVALGFSATFWLRLIHSLGEKIPLPAGVRGYYLSHLGKYVPGKGLTLVMRTAMAAEVGCRPGVAVLTAVYETLTTMAAGALLAVIVLLTQEEWNASLFWKVLVLLALAGIPIVPGVFNLVVQRLVRRVLKNRVSDLPHISHRMLLVGLLLTACGWFFMGISLELFLIAIDEKGSTPGVFRSTAFIAVSYVAGFIASTPGGLGVREWLLSEMLKPQLGAESIVAALLLRLVWTIAELVVSAMVYWLPHRPQMQVSEGSLVRREE